MINSKQQFEKQVTILNEGDIVLFKANDIGKILKIKYIRNSIADYGNDCKLYRKICTPGGPQNITFLTRLGICRLLQCTRKQVPKLLINYFNIYEHHRWTPLETDFAKNLQTVFADIKMILQYRVDPYIIDIYLPDYNISIEFDEHYHNTTIQTKLDNIKEKYIKNKINCSFIRVKSTQIFQGIYFIRESLNELYKK